MPTNLSSTGASFPTQTAPASGEARTAASVETSLQNSADRTEYVKRRLDILHVDGEGARRLRRVASVAALQALSDRPDKTIVEVDGGALYQFDDASTLPELLPRIVKPTAITHPAPGRWIVVGYDSIDAANGVPSLDGNGKVRVAQLDGAVGGKLDGPSIKRGLIDQVFLGLPGGSFTVVADNTWRDVTDCQLVTSSAVLAGDMLVAYVSSICSPAADDTVRLRLRLVKPDAGAIDFPEIVEFGRSGRTMQVVLYRSIAAPLAGSYVFKLQARGASGNSGTFNVQDFNGHVNAHRA